MKKIKKLSTINLLSEEVTRKIRGGTQCQIEGCGVSVADAWGWNHSVEPPPYSGGGSGGSGGNCGCSSCSVEEGGFGFSSGMAIMGLNDGFGCVWAPTSAQH